MFIDKAGAVTAEFPGGVAFAEPLSDGLSLVSADRDQAGRKFGYVDRKDQWAIEPVWDDAKPFHEGLAYVGTWKTWRTAYIARGGPSGRVEVPSPSPLAPPAAIVAGIAVATSRPQITFLSVCAAQAPLARS
jgi:hypothetical protein